MNLEVMVRREEDERERDRLAGEIDALSDLLERTCEAAGAPDLDPADLPALVRQLYQSDRAERRRHPQRTAAEERLLRSARRTPWRPLAVIARAVAVSLGNAVSVDTLLKWGAALQGVPTGEERRACALVRDVLHGRQLTRAEILASVALDAEQVDKALQLLRGARAVRSEQVGRVVRWART